MFVFNIIVENNLKAASRIENADFSFQEAPTYYKDIFNVTKPSNFECLIL